MKKESSPTIGRHLIETEKGFPGATGEFTNLLWDLTIAFKIISNQVKKAGLVEILGLAGRENVHGEQVQKLDVFANDVIYRAMEHGGHLCLMASEESSGVMYIPKRFRKGKYILVYDPLDGSSNIDVNVSIGTIFSILKRQSASGADGRLTDCLQPGTRQVAAGYVIYGSSTMLVYTTGHGVDGFTLDPGIGEFLLSHPHIRIPNCGSIYSVNEGHQCHWAQYTRDFVELLKSNKAPGGKPYSLRYIGSLVSDFHRSLLKGGIYLYPAHYSTAGDPVAKLRLLYEANPLALVAEQAGGRATTGKERVLEIKPTSLHQKVPLVIGSSQEVELYEAIAQGKVQ